MITKKRILIAEDDFLNQVRIKADLLSMGYEFKIVSDGKQALEECLSHEYDIIFMDIAMPEMDGLTASKNIRENGKDLPIIALSAFSERDYQSQTKEAGMNGYLQKPYFREQLKSTIESVA